MIAWVVVVAAACCVGAAPPGGAPAVERPAAATPSRLEERLAAFDERVAKIEGLTAAFEQRRSTPMLKQPMVSRGVVRARGARVRWDTAEPERSTMTMDDREVRVYYPEARVVEVYPIGGELGGGREASGSPLPRLGALRERFEFAEIGAAELGVEEGKGDRYIALELTPKDEQLREHVRLVRVLLDEERAIASRIAVTDADGDVTEIRFTDVRTGDIVSDEDVRLVVPPGTRESRPGQGKGSEGGG